MASTNTRDLSYISPKLWRTRNVERAFAGSHTDQFELALNFLEGSNGFHQDNKRAIYWLTQSANNGNIAAVNQLGVCYIDGVGIIKNESVGFDLIKFAADKGDATAMVNTALLTLNGCGTSVNHIIAAEYLQKAAETGNGQAAYQLGQLYMFGRGIERDENKAFQCFALAADKGLMEAQVGLAQCYSNGIGTDADLQAARKYWVTASLSGDAVAQRSIGERLLSGSDGFAKDPEKARRFLARAAEAGDTQAMFQLAKCYENGIGGPQDKIAKVKWLEKAAEQHHTGAMAELETFIQDQLKFDLEFRDSNDLPPDVAISPTSDIKEIKEIEGEEGQNGDYVFEPVSPTSPGKKLTKTRSFILRMFKKVSGSAAH